jgi:hypothetical protein
MPIHDRHFAATIASHLIRRCLQQLQLQIRVVGNRAGLMPCFGNLAEIIFRKNHGILRLDGLHRSRSHIDQIGP